LKPASASKIYNNKISNEKFLGYNENFSSMISRYLTSVAVVNKSTALKYYERLKKFSAFIAQHYDGSVESIDQIIIKIKKGKIDVYDLLSGFVLHLKGKNGSSPVTLKSYVITVKNFLEYSDIDISPRKFR
jgi:hypothetical protein